ncbi:MAG: hypothetical protein M1549_01680 [Candidatus Dependentiae bacterium]|nr:hypothetical protein [Candidatus Dependentiae bacterium]
MVPEKLAELSKSLKPITGFLRADYPTTVAIKEVLQMIITMERQMYDCVNKRPW